MFIPHYAAYAATQNGSAVGQQQPAADSVSKIVLRHGSAKLVVTLDPRRPKTVQAWIGGHLIWQGIPKKWLPWKLEAFSIAGKPCFIVGLYMQTRHLTYKNHTLYVYGFDGKNVIPRWRGSFMGRDFVDFGVAGSGSMERVITLDMLLDGRLGIAGQEWSGFGFRKAWERGDWSSAKLVVSRDVVEVKSDSRVERYNLEGVREGQ